MQKNIHITGKQNVHMRAVVSNVYIQGSTNVYMKSNTAIFQQTGTIHQDATIIGNDFFGTFIGVHIEDTPSKPQPSQAATVAEAATKVPTVGIIDHMVRPNHESWTRDEDESFCKTARNGKYQG